MAWVATAFAGGTIVNGILQSNAAGRASSKQAASTDRATAEQARQYDQTREDYAPYRNAGTSALSALLQEYGFKNVPSASGDVGNVMAGVTSSDGKLVDPGQWVYTGKSNDDMSSEVMSDPGYQFGLSQGQLGLDRKAAAAGGRVSGAALKSAAEYANNYATTGYNAAYQRRQDRLNRLASLANIGQTATGGSAAAGAAKSNAISNLLSSQGDASAAASMAQGNIWGNTVNQLGAIASKWASTPYNPGSTFNIDSSGGYTYKDPSVVGPSFG